MMGVFLFKVALVVLTSLVLSAVVYLLSSKVQAFTQQLQKSHSPLLHRGVYVLLLLGATVYLIVFTILSVRQHEAFNTYAFDLGVYDQVVWNTSQGRLFEFSLSETPRASQTFNYLGYHFSPALLLLAPFYWIYPDVKILLFLQTLALGIGVIPIYLLARKSFANDFAGLGFSIAYLLFPVLSSVNLFDFHSVAFSVPSLLFILYFVFRERYTYSVILSASVLLIKEELAVAVVAIGIYVAFAQKRRLIGLSISAIGLGWMILVVGLIIPAFLGEPYYYFGRYTYLINDSKGGITLPEITSLLGSLLGNGRAEFVAEALLPLGFTPLLGWSTLAISLPVFGYLLLSGRPEQHSVMYQYAAPLIPFLFAASIRGLARITDVKRNLRLSTLQATTGREGNQGLHHANPWLLPLMIFVLSTSFLSYYFSGRGPLAIGFDAVRYMIPIQSTAIRKAISLIPNHASVAAQTNFVPHLTHRRHIYLLPQLHDAEYILLYAGTSEERRTSPSREWVYIVESVLNLEGYESAFQQNGVVLLRRQPR